MLSDIIQYVKHTKSQSKKQGQLEEVLVTLIENVEDIIAEPRSITGQAALWPRR